jgi:peptidoglycan/LPS O-acetylase OafA/YrhL
MTKLGDVAHGRDNNFNLIRFCAAFAVLISHSFAVATGSGSAEPMRHTLGLTWAYIAVDVFFLTSGFLVTASLLTRQSAVGFAWARALRILPALWVMLALTVFGLGLAVTSSSAHGYLTARETWRYLVENAILLRGMVPDLPGVFGSNPIRRVVNGSLWTLGPEVEMYVILFALGILAAITRRLGVVRWSVVAIAVSAAVLYFMNGNFDNSSDEYSRLTFLFFLGASGYLFKDRIPFSRSTFFVLLAVVLLSAVDRRAFFFAFSVALPYLVFYVAYGFGGRIRAFNRWGDYSYGIYIYAFPVEQTTAHLVPGISALALMGISAIVTLILAMLSWHLLEKRALELKETAAETTRAVLSTATTAGGGAGGTS